MNNNIDCDVVLDLLPLYCDNVVSEKTKSVIHHHLQNCEKCSEEYKKLLSDIPADNEKVNTQEKFINTMKKQKNKTKTKIFASVLIVFFLLLGGFAVEHYWGDNIYAAFVFKDSDVVKVNDNTFKAPKDNPTAFNYYMTQNEGWYFKDQLGSLLVFENDDKVANCQLEFKEFYALYTVDYEDKIKPSSELVNLYAKCIYSSYFKNGVVTYTNGEDNDEHKSTWTVAWNDNDESQVTSARLIVEDGGEEVFSKKLQIQKNADIHGWQNFVLAPTSFTAECKSNKNYRAYIELVDSNSVIYRVCLDETEWTLSEPNDASNDIIIIDANGEYSYWKYLEETNYK